MFDIGSKRILDSTSALRLESIPKTLLVVGGGYIGLELGSVYAALGSKVTVVEMTAGLLPGVDADLVRPAARPAAGPVREDLSRTPRWPKSRRPRTASRRIFEGEADVKDGVYEKVLVAVGRRPNTANIGLDKIGVAVERGFIKTDLQRRTNIPQSLRHRRCRRRTDAGPQGVA